MNVDPTLPRYGTDPVTQNLGYSQYRNAVASGQLLES
jgi:hypothetical protein